MKLNNKTFITFLLLAFSINGFSQFDTLSIYFDFDKSEISYKQKIKITSFALGKEKDIYDINILGYTDFKGSIDYNVELSQQRANNIYSYLLNAGINGNKIITCLGRGKLINKAQIDAQRHLNRRVDIIYKCKCSEQIAETKPVQEKEASNTKPQSIASIGNAKKGDKIELYNIYFIGGRHVIMHASMQFLEILLNTLKAYPKLKIEIQGHICCQRYGDGIDIDTGIKNLSVARAEYIYNYLVSNGIDKNRLRYKGFGADKKIKGSNINDARNRRVEILVTDN